MKVYCFGPGPCEHGGWYPATGPSLPTPGVPMPLTSGEFNILAIFCQHPQKVLSRDTLLDLLHGRAAAVFDRSVDVQISRLRRKIEVDPSNPVYLQTVRGTGYLLRTD